MMNKTLVAVAILSGLVMSQFAHADSFTGGYAHIQSGEGDKLNGTNVKYQHQFRESDFGFVVSGTFASDKENTDGESYDTGSYELYDASGKPTGVMSQSEHHQQTFKTNSTYFAVAGGPSYSLTDSITIYGTVGFAFASATQHELDNGEPNGVETITESAPTIGAGVQWNVFDNFTVDASYETTKLFDTQVNTFSIGGGIKF